MSSPRENPKVPDLLVAGPAQLHDEDLEIFGGQMRAHFGDAWMQIHSEALENVRKITGASETPYLVPGSGTTALEMAITNVFEPGEKVVVAETGFFGTRLREMAGALDLEVVSVDVPTGDAADPSALADACDGAAGVLIPHVETSTGVRHPIADIAAAAREKGALVVVDGIASAGGERVDVDGMGVAAFVTGTQKGLEAPPGLGVVVIGKDGRERIERRTTPPRTWYLSIATWDKYREEWGAWHPHPVTMPVSIVAALASSSRRILETGTDVWIERRADLAKQCREGLRNLGFEPVPSAGVEANLVVACWTDDMAGIQKHLAGKGMVVTGGLGPTKDKAIRVGLMGRTAKIEYVERLLDALREFLAK